MDVFEIELLNWSFFNGECPIGAKAIFETFE